jgi:hypothetical protein
MGLSAALAPERCSKFSEANSPAARGRWAIWASLIAPPWIGAASYSVVRSLSRSTVLPLSAPFAHLRVWQLMNYFGHHAKWDD